MLLALATIGCEDPPGAGADGEAGISIGISAGNPDDGGETGDGTSNGDFGGTGSDDGSSDGGSAGDDGTCETSCTSSIICGDGIVGDDETCDDGNSIPGDGCSGVCQIETNYRCQSPGEPCVSTIVCGDGIISGGEACDDGNDQPEDGCSDVCQLEPGYECPLANTPCVETTNGGVCGNSLVEFPETCDDGNTDPEDGCSETCRRETGYTCPTPGELCVEDEFCGNGVIGSPQERCDDGNTTPGDGCDASCVIEPFFECPDEGLPCISLIVCGDFNVVGDEACDDGLHCQDGASCTDDTECSGIGDGQCTPRSGDGCSSTCDRVEAGYTCPTAANIGGACTETPEPACGDGSLDLGEFCDDGNLDPTDGCTDDCEVTPGYRCPQPGQACELIEVCGNGIRGEGEACDDGSVCANGDDCTEDASVCGDDSCAPQGGDGCTVTCAVEAGFSCAPDGGPCQSLIVCGDGLVGGTESCDLGGVCEDGLTDCTQDTAQCAGIGSGACLHATAPGCNECGLEPGYRCTPGGTCQAAECGDGILAGLEVCDDGSHCEDDSPCTEDTDCTTGTCEARSGDGCNDSCTLEDGFACPTPNTSCVPTDCGDGVPEGTEQCDDANPTLGDGCDPFCRAEPLCTDGPCTSQCGDAIRFADEECDDGNTRDGDGCASDCTIEIGFECTEPTDLPGTIQIPIVIRDFHGSETLDPVDEHVDFEFEQNDGEPRTRDDIVRADGLACPGRPGRGGDLGCPDETYDMKDDTDAVIATISLTGKPVFEDLTCNRTEPPSADNDWDKCTATVTDADSFHQWYTDRPEGVDAPAWTSNPTTVDLLTLVNGSFASGGAFSTGGNAFSFDSRTMSIADPSPTPTGDEAGFFPIDDLELTGATCGAGSFNHNFHFTSEVRYWFEYDADAPAPTLTFSGDDDVFVYINGYLTPLDLGGLHSRLEASFTIDSANAALWGLSDGNIYEIAVFQAEREQCESNYWLTLDGFVPRTSECLNDCGDAITASVEECDDGINDGSYGSCNSDCTLAPRCGDGVLQDTNEVCDDGSDFVLYSTDGTGCGPDCQRSPFCGDGNVDGAFGEVCDNGDLNVDAGAAGDYEACRTDCTPSPSCGDGAATNGEECDDGIDNGTPQSACRVDCTLKCGDSIIDPGEECDNGIANADGYGTCQTDCTLGPRCGDGIRSAANGEECDDGLNNGEYGTCAPGCVLGIRCGDGVIQEAAGERCDNGEDNVVSGYGDPTGCTTRCIPTPYCGDQAVTDDEVCDDGINSGDPGSCSPTCDDFIDLATCGNGSLDPGEQCDDGSSTNGTLDSECDVNCRFKCGNGFVNDGETCDDGVNDGSYGSCSPTCSFAGYCGDDIINGPEQCDDGAGNLPNPYGENLCTTGCLDAPYCGDGRVQIQFGEECDGQSNCTSTCDVFVG